MARGLFTGWGTGRVGALWNAAERRSASEHSFLVGVFAYTAGCSDGAPRGAMSDDFPMTQEDPNSQLPETQERYDEPDHGGGGAAVGNGTQEEVETQHEHEHVTTRAACSPMAGHGSGSSGGGGGSSSGGGPEPPHGRGASAMASESVLGKRPRMAKRAEVVASNPALARTISIDRLPHEQKRLSGLARQPSMLHRMASEEGVVRKTLALLLRPRDWAPAPGEDFPPFCLDFDEVISLCEEAQEVLMAEPTLLKVSAPVKVFGDIHGQFGDLMRLFRQYGSPSKDLDGGDIAMADYLFLGDYVDRGKHSLETICLLLALKVQYPQRVFLVRGNHESPEVNARDGFLYECVERLGGRQGGILAWRHFNRVFEHMPMAALINSCILGVHGGIGRNLETLREIDELPRPLRMGGPHASQLLDLMWSDPTANDAIEGVHANEERGDPVVCFGPDRVRRFLNANGLSLILRAHECVMDGWQRAACGRLITVFSATNYGNRWNNAGALLLVGKDLEIIPKMIYPQEDIEDAWIEASVDGRHAASSGGADEGSAAAAAGAAGGGGTGSRAARRRWRRGWRPGRRSTAARPPTHAPTDTATRRGSRFGLAAAAGANARWRRRRSRATHLVADAPPL